MHLIVDGFSFREVTQKYHSLIYTFQTYLRDFRVNPNKLLNQLKHYFSIYIIKLDHFNENTLFSYATNTQAY